MKRIVFATSQDAEQAFYGAFQKADLDQMMAVWAEDEDVYCVHPSGPRLSGLDQVRESWRQLFAGGATLRFQLRNLQSLRGTLLAVHSVYEHITIIGSARAPAAVIATNIYQNTEYGWRMIVHHASAVAGAPPPEPAPARLH
jgi:uncharacterized protein (TIGR02246 family)